MGAPRSVYLPKQIYTFHRSCLCIVSKRGPVFFKSLWETKTVLTFFQPSLKSTVKTRFSITIKVHQNFALQSSRYSDEQLRSPKMSLQSARSNENSGGPAVFCKREIRCQRKSKCTAWCLKALSRLYSKDGDCLQKYVAKFFHYRTSLRQKGVEFWSCFLFHL